MEEYRKKSLSKQKANQTNKKQQQKSAAINNNP